VRILYILTDVGQIPVKNANGGYPNLSSTVVYVLGILSDSFLMEYTFQA
jgi:hypothetical protein